MTTSERVMACGVAGLLVAGTIGGCPGGGGSNANTNANINDNSGGGPVPAGPAIILGRVSGIDGAPVVQASVSLSVGRSTSTDDNGFFSFSGFETGEVVVARFEAPGFGDTAKSLVSVPRDTANPICVFLAEAGETIALDANTGATQRVGDSVVTLGADALVDAQGQPVSGAVELTTTFIDPSSPDVLAFPGSFSDAMTASSAAVTLESFGFAIYELTQDGADVNLAPGQTATIEYVLPDNAQAAFSAGDTIPLWEFVESTAMWVESGSGDIRSASDGSGRLAWFAEVDHFSAWNCDEAVTEKHSVTGRILLNGVPVGGAEVAAVGVSYNGVTMAMTASDGSFCIDVKRGATVRLELRINGAPVAVHTQEVTVPDESAPCPGPGVEVGDIDVSFDACVTGRVTDEAGTPAAGVRVFIVPGETVVTDPDGSFCGAAAANRDVAVFSEGRPSVTVRTSVAGSCGGSCSIADLELTLPGPGARLGSLSASIIESFDADGVSQSFYAVNGSFFVFDASAVGSTPANGGDVRDFGACRVTTQTSDPGTDSPGFGNIGALDAGNPGTASNGVATINLVRGDPAAVDPPLPFLSGIYQPVETSAQLAALGFSDGDSIRFAFPGGADIGAFSGTVRVPARFDLTQPDVSDPGYALDTTAALPLRWNGGSGSEEILVTIVATDIELTGLSSTTSIQCEFPDTGTATVPAGAMALLPNSITTNSTLSLTRFVLVEVDAPLNSINSTGTVTLVGQTSVSRSVFSFQIPDFCSLITCPDGFVCNSETLTCDPL